MRGRLAGAWLGLRIMRFNALRTLSTMESGTPGPEASITKLYWATWHRALGELAIDVLGARFELDDELQRMFLFTRADTIYGGSNQIQRNVIGERVLGLPREPA
jgi:alkylation response protein AidB-like acyl-CoA dehydrogenase